MQEAIENPNQPPAKQAGPSIWAILRRRWWIIALIVVGALAVTLAVTLTAPPAYRSSLRLQALALDDQEVALYTRRTTGGVGEQIALTQFNFNETLAQSADRLAHCQRPGPGHQRQPTAGQPEHQRFGRLRDRHLRRSHAPGGHERAQPPRGERAGLLQQRALPAGQRRRPVRGDRVGHPGPDFAPDPGCAAPVPVGAQRR